MKRRLLLGRAEPVRAPALAVARAEVRRARRRSSTSTSWGRRREATGTATRASGSSGPSARGCSTASPSTPSFPCASPGSSGACGPTRCSRRAARRRPSRSSAGRSPRVPTRVVADVHGDPAAPTRLYGSPLRKALAPLADALARRGLRRADGVRTISAYTSGVVRGLGAEPTATFAAFMDLEPFTATPPAALPARPSRSSSASSSATRRSTCSRTPGGSRLRGFRTRLCTSSGAARCRGVVEGLVADLPEQTRWTESLPTPEVARALDEATVLVLPSRSEGLGSRRRRGVLPRAGRRREAGSAGSRTSSRTVRRACSSPPRTRSSSRTPSSASSRTRTLAVRLGSAAHEAIGPWLATPEEYARELRELVEKVLAEPVS